MSLDMSCLQFYSSGVEKEDQIIGISFEGAFSPPLSKTVEMEMQRS